MPDLDHIAKVLEAHTPRTLEPGGGRRAAVAVVLRQAALQPEMLLIERAEHPEDPWSGHMAFPGGRVDPGDPNARAAAIRETAEEVGLDLMRGEPLGRLDDQEGRRAGRPAGLVISAFVYRVVDPPPPRPNHEVREALWVPLRDLLDPARHVEYRHLDHFPPFPGIVVGDPERHVVWGLTYRFLERFFEVAGVPLPRPAR